MFEPERINLAGSRPGSSLQPMLTLEALKAWIDTQQVEERVKEILKGMASRYPNQALPSFKKNYNVLLDRAKRQLRAETKGTT